MRHVILNLDSKDEFENDFSQVCKILLCVILNLDTKDEDEYMNHCIFDIGGAWTPSHQWFPLTIICSNFSTLLFPWSFSTWWFPGYCTWCLSDLTNNRISSSHISTFQWLEVNLFSVLPYLLPDRVLQLWKIITWILPCLVYRKKDH